MAANLAPTGSTVLLVEDVGHAHTDPVRTDVARAKDRLVLLVGEEVLAFVGCDGGDVDARSVADDRSAPVGHGH